MGWRRWLGIFAAALVYAGILYALRPNEGSDIAYSLLYLALFLAPAALIFTLRRRVIHLVKTGELGIIERAGRFRGIVQPGLVLLCPFLETLRVLPTSEQAHLCSEDNVLTLDGVPIGVKMLVRYRLQAATQEAAYRAAYEVFDWQDAVRSQAVAVLHQQIGQRSVDDALKTWTGLGEPIREALWPMAGAWGVTILGVDLHSITIPESLKAALEDAQKAEIEAKAVEYRAGGDAERIRQIAGVLSEGGLDAVMTERYIQALERMSVNPSSHIILPIDLITTLRGLAPGNSKVTSTGSDPQEDPDNRDSSSGPQSAAPKTNPEVA
jgi:regulator of protease activity HflC (stomatin/prohibitin superfamily)